VAAATKSRERLKPDDVLSATIPVPPLRKQDGIVVALGEKLGAAARMRAAAERQLVVADGLAKKKLDALFKEGQLESWPEVSLPEIADIVAGVTLGRRLEAEQVRMIAYLRVANVKDGYLDLSDLTETPATEVEIARLKLRDGDLVLTEGGDPDKLGRGTIWSSQVAECIHQNHIFRVRLDREVANPVFVSAQFGSAHGKAYFASHAKQTTGIATINQRVLKAFPLRLPPLPVQDSIAQEHEALVVAQRRLGETVRETEELVGRLPAALLRSAFSGDSRDN
jgi:type I restriction enzyme S subunit